MSYKDSVIKYQILDVNGGQNVPLNSNRSNYVDFHVYCDPDDSVFKMVCYDFAGKRTIIKGVESLGHKPIDKEIHVINIVIIRDNVYRCGRTHFNVVIESILKLCKDFWRSINMEDKVIQMGFKYGFSTEYKIMNKI